MSSVVREWWNRVRAVFQRRELDADLSGELATHLDMAIDEYIAQGLPLGEARRRAMVSLGSLDLAREQHRDARGLPFLESIAGDIHYAFRTLRRSRGFTVVAVTMLALGIGVNTAIFSLVSAVLLRPLPFPNPERLVLLWEDLSGRGGLSHVQPTPADFVAWKEQGRSFEGLAALVGTNYNLTGNGDPEQLGGIRATGNLFAVLGMSALAGRTFELRDDEPDAPPVVVLSERLWTSHFARDPTLIGRTIELNGLPHIVVGVVRSDFQYPERDTEAWVPAKFSAEELAARTSYYMYVLGRLKPDVQLPQAEAETTAISQRLAREVPGGRDVRVRVTATRTHEQITRAVRPALFILLGAVGLVLLIACANVANLLLARGAGRVRELALRQAIGASRGRILRQLLTENVVLASMSVLVGVGFSSVTFSYLSRLVPEGLPAGTSPTLDLRVLIFTATASAALVLGFGIVPALIATHLEPSLTIASSRGAIGTGSRRLRKILVVTEMALTVVLLVAMGLLVRSYVNVTSVELGFQPQNVLIAETLLSPSRYGTFESRAAFHQQVLDRIRTLPGVTSAAYVNYPPVVMKGGRFYVTVEGQPSPPPGQADRNIAIDRTVSGGYFSTLRIPIVRGRDFDARDTANADVPAVIVNQSLVTRHWPDLDPIGHRIKITAAANGPWYTVIGVVDNIRQSGPELPAEPEAYFSLAQFPNRGAFFWPRHLIVRVERDGLSSSLAGAIRRAVREVDDTQPVANVRLMSDVIAAELLNRNTQMMLVGAFAVLALLMASVGLAGVLSYTVAQRTPEIGVRMALGAQRVTVAGDVLRGALGLAATSVVLGLIVALGLSRLLTSLLFSISPTDPTTFVGAGLLVGLIAALASYLPARRAAGIDPATVLRTN